MVRRIDALTQEQSARFDEWADRWIAIGLSTERADWETFETAVRACYRYAGLEEPRKIVRCSSPLVMAFAGPIAGRILEGDAVTGAVGDAVHGAVGWAVAGAVGEAVAGAVGWAVAGAVGWAVAGAVGWAVAVGDAVRGAVRGAVAGAVDGAVGDAVRGAVDGAVGEDWYRYIGGSFWVGGWWWGSPAFVSFFQDVCGLELAGDMGDRARAFQATAMSACWWWPHRKFVMVSDRPLVIHRELVDRARPGGSASYRLHNPDGPAIAFKDGWGVYAWHGVRVPADVILTSPDDITAERISNEPNAEIRRVLMERLGRERLVERLDAEEIGRDDWGTLLRIRRKGDTPIVFVRVVNATAEPDGSFHDYLLRVPPPFAGNTKTVSVPFAGVERRVERTPHAAVAWTFGLRPEEYNPAMQT